MVSSWHSTGRLSSAGGMGDDGVENGSISETWQMRRMARTQKNNQGSFHSMNAFYISNHMKIIEIIGKEKYS